MRRTIRPANKLEAAYQEAARGLGCVICRHLMEIGRLSPKAGQCGATRIHHRNMGDLHGQKQLGQHAVVALGDWHHDGIPPMFWGDAEAEGIYGPSFKFAKPFRAWTAELFPEIPGRGTEVWQAVQDRMLIEQGFGDLVDAVRDQQIKDAA